MAMKHTFVFFGVLSLITTSAEASTLSCNSSSPERNALVQAPHGATHTKKHRLEVGYRSGTKIFTDKPPHEDLGGVHWSYAGFDPKNNVHLICKQDETFFTGVLLNDESGALIPAGQTVIFAPSGNHYLAIEQADGNYFESWSLHTKTGEVEWSGDAGQTNNVDGIGVVVSTLQKPQWSEDGMLIATSECEDDSTKSGEAVLINTNGKWSWRTNLHCQKRK